MKPIVKLVLSQLVMIAVSAVVFASSFSWLTFGSQTDRAGHACLFATVVGVAFVFIGMISRQAAHAVSGLTGAFAFSLTMCELAIKHRSVLSINSEFAVTVVVIVGVVAFAAGGFWFNPIGADKPAKKVRFDRTVFACCMLVVFQFWGHFLTVHLIS